MSRRDSDRNNAPSLLTAASVDRPAITLREALGPFRRRFGWAGIYFLVVFLVGMVGYMLIEHWRWFDALYMAVTTVTSVGFMEVRPLTPAGRSFTIAIENLKNHFIVCGAGRMGRVVVAELIESGHPFVVIENNPSRLATLLELHSEVLMVEGDATREQTLRSARIARASGLATCLADDADNLLVCITARHLNPELTTVARAYNEESVEKLRRAGAEHVVSPNQSGGIRMAFSLLRPYVVSFLDCVIADAGLELRLEQATIPATSHLMGQTLAEAKIPQRTGLIILGLRRAGEDGPLTYNPGPETRLEAGDVMIVMGGAGQVQQLRDYADVALEV
jgi:voltage-gated potassium channel